MRFDAGIELESMHCVRSCLPGPLVGIFDAP